jgi:hypothetical protein
MTYSATWGLCTRMRGDPLQHHSGNDIGSEKRPQHHTPATTSYRYGNPAIAQYQSISIWRSLIKPVSVPGHAVYFLSRDMVSREHSFQIIAADTRMIDRSVGVTVALEYLFTTHGSRGA